MSDKRAVNVNDMGIVRNYIDGFIYQHVISFTGGSTRPEGGSNTVKGCFTVLSRKETPYESLRDAVPYPTYTPDGSSRTYPCCGVYRVVDQGDYNEFKGYLSRIYDGAGDITVSYYDTNGDLQQVRITGTQSFVDMVNVLRGDF